jgi:hypothetical protein
MLNYVIPAWGKWLAVSVLVVAVWGHGYVRGIHHAYGKVATATEKIIYKQGKVTTKVITKYIKVAEKIKESGDESIKAGQSYDIKFPNDDYIFNKYFVSVYNSAITGDVSSLPERDAGDPSGVSVAQALDTSVNNIIAGRMWQNRALACEEWTEEQESLNGK